MYKASLSKIKIESKLAIIRESISELNNIITSCTKEEFVTDKDKFAISEHYLRRALEALFDIGGHIISRFPYSPSKRPKTFKEIASALGEKNIIDKKFAVDKLTKMAGYRNRLVHFYNEITKEELYQIIDKDLRDLETFAKSVIEVVKSPEKAGLEIED